MSDLRGKFGDLGVRVLSALVLAALGITAIWQGGLTLAVFVAILGAAVAWEIARMLDAARPMVVGGLTGLALLLASLVPWEMRVPFLVAATGISYGLVDTHKALFTISHLIIGAGALSFLTIVTSLGLAWTVWLVGVVVVTDVAGYFAGRTIGGPKFWPSLSPKKTWSGTVAGWGGAVVFGIIMMGPLDWGPNLILLSVALAFASQMGDIFESFVKRRAGVKDSSSLIPGHGGVWDRFDGMLGAALVFWPLYWVL